MKLYYFNPNSYGQEFFVMSSSPVEAHKALVDYLKAELDKEIKAYANYWDESDEECSYFYGDYLNMFKDINPEDPTTFPNQYTLEVIEENWVIQTEIS